MGIPLKSCPPAKDDEEPCPSRAAVGCLVEKNKTQTTNVANVMGMLATNVSSLSIEKIQPIGKLEKSNPPTLTTLPQAPKTYNRLDVISR
jgi:hypothetical protein